MESKERECVSIIIFTNTNTVWVYTFTYILSQDVFKCLDYRIQKGVFVFWGETVKKKETSIIVIHEWCFQLDKANIFQKCFYWYFFQFLFLWEQLYNCIITLYAGESLNHLIWLITLTGLKELGLVKTLNLLECLMLQLLFLYFTTLYRSGQMNLKPQKSLVSHNDNSRQLIIL